MMRDPTASPSPGADLPELLPEFGLVLPEFERTAPRI